jgi:hypothetical protein
VVRQIIILSILILSFYTGSAQKVSQVEAKDLPAPVDKYIRTNLPGAKIFKSVSHVYKGMIQYDVAVDINGKKQVLVFEKSGKFIRKSDEADTRKNQSTQHGKTVAADTSRQVSSGGKQGAPSLNPRSK